MGVQPQPQVLILVQGLTGEASRGGPRMDDSHLGLAETLAFSRIAPKMDNYA